MLTKNSRTKGQAGPSAPFPPPPQSQASRIRQGQTRTEPSLELGASALEGPTHRPNQPIAAPAGGGGVGVGGGRSEQAEFPGLKSAASGPQSRLGVLWPYTCLLLLSQVSVRGLDLALLGHPGNQRGRQPWGWRVQGSQEAPSPDLAWRECAEGGEQLALPRPGPVYRVGVPWPQRCSELRQSLVLSWGQNWGLWKNTSPTCLASLHRLCVNTWEDKLVVFAPSRWL